MITPCFLSSGAFNSSMISVIILLIFASSSYCQEYEAYYRECVKPFNCGLVTNLSYPFWGQGVRSEICGLGGFGLRCIDGEFPALTIDNQDFLVKSVNHSGNEMEITPKELWDNACSADNTYKNVSLDNNLFSYKPDRFSNMSLFYKCSNLGSPFLPRQKYTCPVNSEEFEAFYGYDGLRGGWTQETSKCSIKIEIPVQKRFLRAEGLDLSLGDVIREGFSIGYKYNESCVSCRNSGGICGTNITIPNLGFTCFCPDQAYPVSCPNLRGSNRNIKLKVIIGAMAVLGTVLTCGFGFLIHKITQSLLAPRKNPDFEAFLEKHGPQDVKRYSYSQVKKMTNSFQEKLGQGGFGSVYKGTLPEGGVVAVKMLSSSEEEGTQGFLNEVAAISRTSHVNIVALLGFCLDTHKRALVYEFMPNGSLDKFICSENGQQLGWEMLHKIAIGIAQGLEYLHRGCNTRIVHFDIKPQNVLLDENLTPKISDFGLAKLCTRKESKVSMLEARGTIGYIAPEVFCINFGQVSSKSDVYSFGMMILEMAGGRNKDVQQVERNDSSEMYFPGWIYRSLVLENEDEDISEDNDEFVRKLKLVGLWCIQTNPSDRPTMSKVVEMLQGSIQALEIPPKPFLSSSPALKFPLYSSTASTVDLGLLPSAKASHPLVL